MRNQMAGPGCPDCRPQCPDGRPQTLDILHSWTQRLTDFGCITFLDTKTDRLWMHYIPGHKDKLTLDVLHSWTQRQTDFGCITFLDTKTDRFWTYYIPGHKDRQTLDALHSWTQRPTYSIEHQPWRLDMSTNSDH